MNDLRFLVTTGLQMLFFCSGVFFNLDAIPPRFHKLFLLNPMATLLHNYREVLLYHQWPDWWMLFYISLGSMVFIYLMWLTIRQLDHIYPRIIL